MCKRKTNLFSVSFVCMVLLKSKQGSSYVCISQGQTAVSYLTPQIWRLHWRRHQEKQGGFRVLRKICLLSTSLGSFCYRLRPQRISVWLNFWKPVSFCIWASQSLECFIIGKGLRKALREPASQFLAPDLWSCQLHLNKAEDMLTCDVHRIT